MGRELETESGLYYYRARYYDAAIGRFLQEDPVGAPNQYSYVRNDPISLVDPSGEVVLLTLTFGLTIAGGLLGGILSAIAAAAAGCCPLEIAVAAGIGAVSGLVGTAAGLAFKNPAVAGAVGGAVADVVAQAFNGQAFDPVSTALSA